MSLTLRQEISYRIEYVNVEPAAKHVKMFQVLTMQAGRHKKYHTAAVFA